MKMLLDIEALRHGLPMGALMTFVARSHAYDSVGKSDLVGQMVREAIHRGDKVLYINLEAECATSQSLAALTKK